MSQMPMQNQAVSTPYAFQGGLDLASAALAVPGGRAIAAMNYEPVVNGYARVQGHEKFDGRLPSTQTYQFIDYKTDSNGGLQDEHTITGGTSGATARIIEKAIDPVVATKGRLTLTNVVGTFINGELLTQDASVRNAVADSAPYGDEGVTANVRYSAAAAAAAYLSTLIQSVPGSGPVRGGFVLDGNVYAVRDNAGATAAVIHKATGAGWVAQSFGRSMWFTKGLVEILEGQTVTGATSGATAIVDRIIVRDGEWGAAADADKAVGYLIMHAQVGAFQPNEVLKVGATNVATNSTADSAQIILPPGGRYQFKVKNFYGATNRKRVYGVYGTGLGFEYDGGSVLVPIVTGTPVDQPTRVFEIANHLGFCFPGGSIQVSSPGEPCVFNAILGAAEIGMGDDITDVIDSNDSAVIFFGKNKVCALSGRGIDSFVFDELTEEAGAEAWTAQRIGKTVYLDRRGLRDLNATASFGNFKAGALSELFERFLQAKRRAGAKPVASLRVKGKSQYRLYYDDGTGFTVYMGRKNPEMLPFETNGLGIYSTFSGEMNDGSEGLFACCNDGFVYRLDSGNSFANVPVRSFVMMPFNHLGKVDLNKRYQGVTVELEAGDMTRLQILAQFDYGEGQPLSGYQDFGVYGSGHFATVEGGGGDFILTSGGGTWDATTWGDEFFASAYQGMAEVDIAGSGRNISLIFSSPGYAAEPPHTLQSFAIRWSPRGQVKRTAA